MNEMVSHSGSNALVPTSMEGALRLAEMMARWKTGPSHLINSPGDCLMVVEMAMRFGMSPFAVAQCTSVIQGKIMLEGKLVSAAVHSSGLLSKRLDYDFTGEGDKMAVTVRGTLRGEDKPRELTVALKDAKTSNQMWTKQPQQQLVYFSTRAWARRHVPEVMLGVYSPEEFEATPATPFTGTTIEAEPETMGQQIGDRLPDHSEAPRRKTWAELLGEIEESFRTSYTRDEVDQTLASDQVQKALDTARNGTREKLDALIKAAMDRTATDDGSAMTDFPGDRPSQAA